MPRVCASNNDPYDFCQRHFPDERQARITFGNIGEGPDGRGNCFEHGTEHPDYGGAEYRCYVCGRLLKSGDNHPKGGS